MKFSVLATLVVATLLSHPAVAQDCLPDLVAVAGWSAKPEQSMVRVGIGLRNEGDTDIKMVRGTVSFRDPLGDPLAPVIDIFPDTILLAGNPGNIGVYLLDGDIRLGHVDRNMVSTIICVTGVVLADGSVIKAGT